MLHIKLDNPGAEGHAVETVGPPVGPMTSKKHSRTTKSNELHSRKAKTSGPWEDKSKVGMQSALNTQVDGIIVCRYIDFVILVFSTFCFAKKLSENGMVNLKKKKDLFYWRLFLLLNIIACCLDLGYDQFDFAPYLIFLFPVHIFYFYVDVQL